MARSNKLILIIAGIILAVVLCNLTGAILGGQTGTLASSAASIAQSQALSEQARANQQMARALQSVAHTMNLMLLVVFLLAVLGAGLYVWKTRNDFLTKRTSSTADKPSAPLSAPEPPLRVVYVSRPRLPNRDEPEFQVAEFLDALLSGEEWE